MQTPGSGSTRRVLRLSSGVSRSIMGGVACVHTWEIALPFAEWGTSAARCASLQCAEARVPSYDMTTPPAGRPGCPALPCLRDPSRAPLWQLAAALP